MVRSRSRVKKRVSRRKSQLLLLMIATFVVGVFYYYNNGVSAGALKVSKKIVSESYEEVKVSPETYKVMLADENGNALTASALSKISVFSRTKGKDCGVKGSTKEHPNGGCYTMKEVDVPITVAGDGSLTFSNKLFHITQVIQTSSKKQKKFDYYSSGLGTAKNFIIWSANTIVIKTADQKSIIAELPVKSNAYLKQDPKKAKDLIINFNNSPKVLKIPSAKIGVATQVNSPVTLSAEVIASGDYQVKFIDSDGSGTSQSYVVYNWYKECDIVANEKERNCTKTTKYVGDGGMAGSDGIVKFKAYLINIGDDYFIGEKITGNKFRIWSKTEVVAINKEGKKLASKTISSPFYRAKLNLLVFKSMDATKRSKDKQSMLAKYNEFVNKEYTIKITQ